MLTPCRSCRRHVRAGAVCPFCAARGGVLVVALAATACGAQASHDGAVDASTDTATDTHDVGRPSPVYGAPPDAGDAEVRRPQAKCSTDDDCDLLGTGESTCELGDPTPTCVARPCDPSELACRMASGICVAEDSSGACRAACEFDDTGAAPRGCTGNTRCVPYAWARDTLTGATIGVGYCRGGCRDDADCVSGRVCQRESGACVTAAVTYALSPLSPCTSSSDCHCVGDSTRGYCALACFIGETSCPSGTTCSTPLPASGDVVFTKQPLGITGACLKDCSTDADCGALGARCVANAGTTQKTCHPAPRW